MEFEITKMSSKGQVVIPSEIREKLLLREGQAMSVSVQDGLIFLKRIDEPTRHDLETLKEIRAAWGEIESGDYKRFKDEKDFFEELDKW
jgi:AbrB family looped-hinge helix DNA binding protein